MARSAALKGAEPAAVADRRLAQGDRTRKRIIAHGVRLAAAEGMESLTVGRLAEDLKMSKSGLFASFGSKEALQLEVLRASMKPNNEAIAKALRKPRGIARLTALCENIIVVHASTPPGHHSFMTHGLQFTTRAGPIAAETGQARRWWRDALRRLIREAQELGHIDRNVDVPLLAWDLDAICIAAGAIWQLDRDPKVTKVAKAALRARLAAAAPRDARSRRR